MRLFLLPVSTRRTLIYCQRLNQQLSSELTYIDKISSKAAKTWTTWEKGEKQWQQKVTQWGNAAFKKIPYEEWGLKSIPPLSARRKSEEQQSNEKVDIVFPGKFIQEHKIGDILRRIGTERKGLHSKGMWWSVAGMPVTIPFGLIPIVPNIPFFYLVFRAWSHWRALSGSKHIEFILDKSLYSPQPSPALDVLYTAGLFNKNRNEISTNTQPIDDDAEFASQQVDRQSEEVEEQMLLQQWNAKLIAQALEIPELEVELERAIWQVEESLKAKEELEDEKKHMIAAAAAAEREEKR